MRILSALVVLFFAASSFASDMVPVRSITVTGIAKRMVVPDEAHVSVNLNAMEGKLASAKTAHDEKLKKLMGIVKNAGIDEKKVKTQNSSIQPVYEYREVKTEDVKDNCITTTNGSKCPPAVHTTKNIRVLNGYRAQTTVDITVGDTSKLGDLMDAISNAGFEKGATEEWGNLISTYYTLSNPDKIRDEMLVEAITNAKDKASKMASAVGASVTRVYQMSESNAPSFDFPRPMMMSAAAPMMAMAKSADAAYAPPAGEQEVNASVNIMFELK